MFLAITHPFATLLQAYDLHVLGTPPAFILSQDQTLNNEITLSETLVRNLTTNLTV